ncbi:MAG: 30S ribosomal protein S11 [Patescibacteria group bacterium]|nr:30S ribosomal protein S11 [Patescibacteria group bacterium]
MGKKKVAKTENKENALTESAKIEGAVVKAVTKSSSKKVDTGSAYVKATYNNTLISVTDEKGNLMAWSSAGSLGFSGPKKATPFAASKVVAALAEKLKKTGPVNLHVMVNGVGGGRDSAVRSFANQGFNILSIRDVTPIPHNGPRPTKTRRI